MHNTSIVDNVLIERTHKEENTFFGEFSK